MRRKRIDAAPKIQRVGQVKLAMAKHLGALDAVFRTHAQRVQLLILPFVLTGQFLGVGGGDLLGGHDKVLHGRNLTKAHAFLPKVFDDVQDALVYDPRHGAEAVEAKVHLAHIGLPLLIDETPHHTTPQHTTAQY